MQIDQDYIEQLMVAKITGNLTEEESRILTNAIETDPANHQLWLELAAANKLWNAGAYSAELNNGTAWKKVEAGITGQSNGKIKRLFLRVAAVAAILIIGFFGVSKLINPNEKSGKNSDAIVLNLANGKKIEIVEKSMTVKNALNNSVLNSSDGSEMVNAQKDKLSLTALNTLDVPTGYDYHLWLADSTEVWLNSKTELQFPLAFEGDRRLVKVSGEAYFKVAHNAQKPFIVSTPTGDIRVLGTEFNIKCYTGEPLKASLVTGKIKFNRNTDSTNLLPGQEVQLDESGMHIEEFDETVTLAWMKGAYFFRNEDLTALKNVLERWYGVEVHINPDVAKKRFSGALERKKPLINFLTNISTTSNIKFSYTGNSVEFY